MRIYADATDIHEFAIKYFLLIRDNPLNPAYSTFYYLFLKGFSNVRHTCH
jgi:hypothetical protein